MVRPNASRTATVRSFFVIDPARRIGLMLTCPMPTGRNFDEILRAVASLQFTANPTPGEDVVVASAYRAGSTANPSNIRRTSHRG